MEKQARGQPPNERQHIRATQAKPILERFHTWLQATLRTLSKGSSMPIIGGHSSSGMHWLVCR
ncbi:MAG: hypothetical protein U5L02_11405 [Rheinheimera sp.]|nr:hypothetical protein [Rheinheimera sp.]